MASGNSRHLLPKMSSDEAVNSRAGEAGRPPSPLADPDEAARRIALLKAPHMAPLEAHRRWLEETREGLVPHADPLDGGTGARVLFLLEKPGRSTLPVRFVSRDNPTPTAHAIASFMAQAAIPREATLLWNAVPWWNGTARVTARERHDGASALAELLAQLANLANLRTVVTVGATAAAVYAASGCTLPAFASAHPSPNVRAAFPERWAAIPAVWHRAYEAASTPAPAPALRAP